jgi:hypothetical protein
MVGVICCAVNQAYSLISVGWRNVCDSDEDNGVVVSIVKKGGRGGKGW